MNLKRITALLLTMTYIAAALSYGAASPSDAKTPESILPTAYAEGLSEASTQTEA